MPADPDDLTPIDVIVELRRRYGDAPTYGQLWVLLASGTVPARRDGRAWKIPRAAVPLIAEHFRLIPRAIPAA
jgi:hypothetical protein